MKKKMRTILDLRSITNCKHPAVPIRLGSGPFIPLWVIWGPPDFDLECFFALLFVAQFLLSDHLVAAGRLVVVVDSAAVAVT